MTPNGEIVSYARFPYNTFTTLPLEELYDTVKHLRSQSQMSLPSCLKTTFSPQEIQFLTENEPITILPRYTMNGIELITDNIPSIRAMQRLSVPLWFALILKRQNKCSLVPPDWLNLKSLQDFYQYEVNELTSFAKLPNNWLELSKLIFEYASDDINDEVYKLKSLVQDLKEIRMIKVQKGLELINESHLQLDNLSLLEINEIRPFVVEIMGKLTSLDKSTSTGMEQEEMQYGDNDGDIEDHL